MNSLLSLDPVRRSSEVLQLRRLYDEINIQIRSLENLEVDFDTYGSLLLPILYKCLPNDLVLMFNRQNSDREATITGLLAFLRVEIEAREKSQSINFNQDKNFRNEERNPEKYRNYATKKVNSAATLNTNTEKIVCDFCQMSHLSKHCNLSLSDKYKALYDQFKCKRCLGKYHKKVFCKSKVKCSSCQSIYHHVSLCPVNHPQNKREETKVHETSISSLFPENTQLSPSQKSVIYYQTLRAKIVTERGVFNVRLLCDTASEKTYVLRSISEKAGLKTVGHEGLKIFTFGSKNAKICNLKRKKITLTDCNSNKNVEIQALETEFITGSTISSPSNQVFELLKQKGYTLSDFPRKNNNFEHNNQIDILLGSDYLNCVLTGKSHRLNNYLLLYESLLGYTLSGREIYDRNQDFEVKSLVQNTHNLFISSTPDIERNLAENLRFLWDVEFMGMNDCNLEKKECDDRLIHRFEQNLIYKEGRYETNLLWKSDRNSLENNNFQLAKRQFDRLRGQLDSNIFLKEQFREIINYQLQNNIIQECNQIEGGYFMPFRGVIRNDKESSKVRIVFNCSSHIKGNSSLNDLLEQGPNLNPNILDVILRFRKFKVGFCGDIEKAFLMIVISEEDRKYLKFLWYSDDESTDFKVMQMNRVVFGANCSPFLLCAVIKFHIKKYAKSNRLCFEMLDGSLYVDDLCHGAGSAELGFALTSEAVSILSAASFKLRKLHTNSRELYNLWVDNGLCEKDSFVRNSKLKVLGVEWNTEEDNLRVDVTSLMNSLDSLKNTKRGVLSAAAKIFDPAGFAHPYVVRIKRLMQEIWERGLDWDSELPDDLRCKWKKWCNEIEGLGKLRIERYYFSGVPEEDSSIEIHIFCDSSIIAYGAVAYFRCEALNGEVTTSFIMSKSRIAPLKRLSLPRLELMGTLIGARLWKYLSRVFQGLCDKVFFWTDSEICLCWIKGSAREWKQFVSNRVLEIQDCTSPDKWNFCPGLENPADKLTRGESSHALCHDDVWWYGPPWLRNSMDNWPVQKFKTEINDQHLERSKTATHIMIVKTESIIDETRFSNLNKLLRITALVIRFLNKLRKRTNERGPVTTEEIQNAEDYWVKRVQSENYASEIELLRENKPVPAQSKLSSLAPYLDEKHMLRVKGRLEQTELSANEKHPIIIPKSKLTELIIFNEHLKGFHAGVMTTLFRVRKNFWIPKGRQVVKKVLGTCLVCKKYTLKPATQLTGQLPQDRVTESAPFTVVGTDFTGAVQIKTGSNVYKKVYIVLFTCAVTRAVHLEVVSDMSTKSFILSFRRFLARRGNCTTIYSDNAKGFRSSCEIIKGFKKIIVDPIVKDFISKEKISWKFIPERSPWWGGFWERLMKSIKEPLKKVLGKALLNLEEFTTILTEIECVLNSRPLTYESNELGEPRALTPSDFLFPGHSTKLPEHFAEIFNKVSDKETLTRRKLFQTKMLKQVWIKWKDQYLLQLRSAHHMINSSAGQNLKPGDVVLIEGPKRTKLLWDMGVVDQVLPGRDEKVRACIVRTPKGLFRRSIQLLYPFEISK